MTCKTDNWTGCYDLGWQKIISPQSFSHPAKFSRGLIFCIIEHALEDGLIQPGQTILDPFGGVGLGALPALQNGLNWVGVELEPKFVELGRQNITLWNGRFSGMPKWTGQAVLLQGDSRRLAEAVARAGLVVGSPPYANGEKGHPSLGSVNKDDWGKEGTDIAGRRGLNGNYGSSPSQLAEMKEGDIQAVISSPPFAGNSGGRGEASRNGIDSALFDRHSGGMKGGTGSDPANLDHLPMGAPPTAIISSPPYVDNMERSGGIDPAKSNHIGGPHSQMNRSDTRYGETPGQLGAMKPGEISAVIASPPFVDSVGSDDPDKRGGLFRDAKRRNDTNLTGTYGETEGQLGGMKAGEHSFTQAQPGQRSKENTSEEPDTFWASAKTIIEQCALLLPVGGAAIWVLKAYVKDGKIVDFPGQWQQLCESCGFETVHIHRAMLVKENGEQETMAAGHDTTGTTTNLLGEEVTTEGKPMMNKKNIVARKSFFRRLHERRRPDLAIDFETVLCTIKR